MLKFIWRKLNDDEKLLVVFARCTLVIGMSGCYNAGLEDSIVYKLC